MFLALAVVLALTTAYFLVRGQLIGEVKTSLRERATAIALIAKRLPQGATRRPVLPRLKVPPAPFAEPEGYVQFVSPAGKVRLTPGEHVRLPTKGALAVAAGHRPNFFAETTVAGKHLGIYTARVGNGAVEVARSMSDVDSTLRWIRLVFLAISAAAVAGTGLSALFLARAALRPVENLTDDVERMAATRELTTRRDEGRADELGRLARAFNSMLEALRESLSAQRQLVADASHELRTPLTTARAGLETLDRHPDLELDDRQDLIRRARRELEEMTHLIDELVALARGDAHDPELELVQLDELTAEVVAAAARRSGREIRLNVQPTIVYGAPADLMRAINNLLHNALKWSPADAPVDVCVGGGTVSVRDRGPGIDAEDEAHVFDRFYRAANARTTPGSGLGLAIVKQVAEAHRGSASVRSAPGGGSTFTISLPAHEPKSGDAETHVEPPTSSSTNATSSA